MSARRSVVLLLALLASCGTTDLSDPQPLDVLGLPWFSARRTLVHTPVEGQHTPEDPRVPADLDALQTQGFGQTATLAAEPHQPRTQDGSPAPKFGWQRRKLLTFVHLADIQLADDESPNRAVSLDGPGLTSGAFRPQEGMMCRLLDAAVRTVNVIRPLGIDALVLGGDNADNAQRNEIQWVGKILNGGPVECDSGADDDEAEKEEFQAQGLKVPWFWVSGNHDVLVHGTNAVDENERKTSTGTAADLGTRDYSKGGIVTQGDVPADPLRLPLYPKEIIAEVSAIADGPGPHLHGLAGLTPGSEFLDYRATPVPGRPIDLVVVDTTAHSGSADGLVFQKVFDAEVKPALQASLNAGHWVIVTGHHPSWDLTDGGQVFGTAQAGTMTPAQFRHEVTQFPNVLFLLSGHSHENRITLHPAEQGDAQRPLFEVQTSSLADWPGQMRLVEVVDEDATWISARLTAFDTPGTGPGTLVADALARMTLDRASGWNPAQGEGTPLDRNVTLWIRKPAGFLAHP